MAESLSCFFFFVPVSCPIYSKDGRWAYLPVHSQWLWLPCHLCSSDWACQLSTANPSTQSFSQVIGSKDLSVTDQYLDDGIRVQSDELGGDILLEWSIIVWRHLGCVVLCLVPAWVWDPLSLQTMSYFKFHEQKTGPVSCLWPGTSKVQVYLTISKSSTRTLVFIHCRLHTCKVCMFLLRNVLPWVDNCCLCVVGNDLFSSLTV